MGFWENINETDYKKTRFNIFKIWRQNQPPPLTDKNAKFRIVILILFFEFVI